MAAGLKGVLLALFGLALLALGGCGDDGSVSASGEPRDGDLPAGVVARVGDTDITRADLDARIAELRASERRLAAREGEQPRTRGAAEEAGDLRSELEWLVQVAIFESVAARCGGPCVVTPADVDRELARYADARFGGSQTRLEADAARMGLNLAQVREELRLDLLGQRLQQHPVASADELEARLRASVVYASDEYTPTPVGAETAP